jgi:hypothetical protein
MLDSPLSPLASRSLPLDSNTDSCGRDETQSPTIERLGGDDSTRVDTQDPRSRSDVCKDRPWDSGSGSGGGGGGGSWARLDLDLGTSTLTLISDSVPRSYPPSYR